MSGVRPGTCGDPGPYAAHCTEDPGHRYSCYDAGEDVSFNDGTMADSDAVHACEDKACPDHEPLYAVAKAGVLRLWCPGCDDLHMVWFAREPGETGPVWSFDGSMRRPTVEPSILVNGMTGRHATVCHSFLRDGRWQFLDDSTHDLAGQTVDLAPLPLWLIRDAERSQ